MTCHSVIDRIFYFFLDCVIYKTLEIKVILKVISTTGTTLLMSHLNYSIFYMAILDFLFPRKLNKWRKERTRLSLFILKGKLKKNFSVIYGKWGGNHSRCFGSEHGVRLTISGNCVRVCLLPRWLIDGKDG